jgi:uncharacterized protein (DUF1778 family)
MARISPTKTSRIEIRIDAKNKRLLEKAAALKGKSISSYVLSKSLASAQKDIEQVETLVLKDSDQDLFYELVTNPPAPNEALKKLLKPTRNS